MCKRKTSHYRKVGTSGISRGNNNMQGNEDIIWSDEYKIVMKHVKSYFFNQFPV